METSVKPGAGNVHVLLEALQLMVVTLRLPLKQPSTENYLESERIVNYFINEERFCFVFTRTAHVISSLSKTEVADKYI